MSSRDNNEPVGSTVKRIATLNDHEEHILRRRINAYQKIHHKEIAEVSSQLEEIRESMKALATDSLYGTHALDHASSQRSSSRSSASNQGRKSGKLRRTQSFPDLLDGSADVSASASASNSSFPALKREQHAASRLGYKLGEKAAFNDLMKSRSKSFTASHHVHDSIQFGVEARNSEEQGHKKLERSKTAPVAMLQPLLKTTPEMMRKKIHISTSNRLSNEELLRRKCISPRFGDKSSRQQSTHLQQTQPADVETTLHRPKIVSDSHRLMMNLKPASHSSYESKAAKITGKYFPAKKVQSQAEQNADAFLSFRTVKGHESKPSNKRIVKPFHKEDLFEASEVSDKEKDNEGLRNCRYLRFAKDSQESNRI